MERKVPSDNGGINGKILVPLFERKVAKGRSVYKLFSSTIFLGIIFIWLYRILYVPKVGEDGRFVWIGMFTSEVLFGAYWIITQSVRWNVTFRIPFKDRLSQRYEKTLPDVDVFVCTADPIMEPPSLVINTILSVMSFNYPPGKLCIYLSDDGGSEFTFYALLEASEFSKYWLPFTRKFNIEPRSPGAYFDKSINLQDEDEGFAQEWFTIKKLYEDMKSRIDSAMEKGSIQEEVKSQHKGFAEWNSKTTKQDHQSIVQILIDRRNNDTLDIDGFQLPMLVYLAREKRPQEPHNFKAGSMNALIRVSEVISNAPIILNLDCDMYLNDPDALRETLCFFMDEKEGHQVSYVQYPQRYGNNTENDLYSNIGRVVNKIELCGMDGYRAALYCGTGCFHRRESLSGKPFTGDHKLDLNKDKHENRTVHELEEIAKVLADCDYEKGTQWGNEMGLIYGSPVEDIPTGLKIQCRGWKPVYYDPIKNAFMGIAPSTLDLALIQYKRWSEGMFQVFISKYCPFIYGHGKIEFGAQMGYCVYLLWPAMSFPTLYYAVIPSLCLLRDIPLFPKVSSVWFLPFAYVFVANYTYSLVEALFCSHTAKGWWNTQRMLLIRRTTSFFLAGIDTVIRQLGFAQSSFVLTAKVTDDDALKRYEEEIMEFGSESIMFTMSAIIAMINLFSLMILGVKKVVFGASVMEVFEHFAPQMILTGLLVSLNLSVYQAMFFRSDKGQIPSSVMFKSIVIASVACLISMY